MGPPLRSLLAKYRELRRLRAGDDGGEPVARMRRVAARWPGALREIDELPLAVIEARIEALERALGGAPPPAWAPPLAQFHGLMRACLAVKRQTGRDPEAAAAWVREVYRPEPDEPAASALLSLSAAIARPPEGRLSRLVLRTVAARHGLSSDSCERLLFPPSPRRAAAD